MYVCLDFMKALKSASLAIRLAIPALALRLPNVYLALCMIVAFCVLANACNTGYSDSSLNGLRGALIQTARLSLNYEECPIANFGSVDRFHDWLDSKITTKSDIFFLWIRTLYY